MNKTIVPIIVAFLLPSLVTLVGCGAVEESYGVTGRVTLDGSPLENATVTFVSDDSALIGASSRTDASGMYSAEISSERAGLLMGQYKVRISTYEDGNPDVEPPIPTVEERVPTKYNTSTELTAEVKPEMNVFDFTLDSDGEIEP